MTSFNIVTIHSYLSFGLTILFLYQTVVNYFVFKQNVINRSYMKSQIGLCLFSTLYTFLNFLLVLKFSFTFNLFLLNIMWISGSLGTYFYISAIKGFLNDRTKNLFYIQKLTLVSAGGALVSLILWAITGNNFFVHDTIPFVEYNNLYMQQIGGMNPSTLVKFLSFFVFVPTIYSSVYFLHYILKSKNPQKMLLIGVLFNLFAIVNDCTISFWDPAYLLPVMFMAHLFEILRMTYSNQLVLGKRLNLLTNDLIQTSKLSEAGTHFAFLAHEILNPLFAAMGYLDRLKMNLKNIELKPEIGDYFLKIDKQHEKIKSLAKNVKKFTKVGNESEMTKASLNQIILDSLETVQIRAINADVSIKYESLKTDYQIYCFQDQIIQVITNLINNSIEAISSENDRWIEILLSRKSDERTIVISVKDSGKGIPAEVQSRMWESRFTTKKEIGMGLGLSLCHSIITSHGGEIYLNTASPNTEFVIEIPINELNSLSP